MSIEDTSTTERLNRYGVRRNLQGEIVFLPETVLTHFPELSGSGEVARTFIEEVGTPIAIYHMIGGAPSGMTVYSPGKPAIMTRYNKFTKALGLDFTEQLELERALKEKAREI